MKAMHSIIRKISITTDVLARVCLFAVMLLIVTNVIARKILVRPIPGAYELVGLFTAMGIALALANCALQDGHIAVGIFVDKLSLAKRQAIQILSHLISLGFWTTIAWGLFVFASTTFRRGMVSATAQLPIYPFILVVALGVFAFCLVLVSSLAQSVETVLKVSRHRRLERGQSLPIESKTRKESKWALLR